MQRAHVDCPGAPAPKRLSGTPAPHKSEGVEVGGDVTHAIGHPVGITSHCGGWNFPLGSSFVSQLQSRLESGPPGSHAGPAPCFPFYLRRPAEGDPLMHPGIPCAHHCATWI